MNGLFWFVNDSMSARLTLALLHFLWQGCFAGFIVVLGGGLLRHRSANTRYALNITVMMVMALCLPITYLLVDVSGLHSHSIAKDSPASLIALLNETQSSLARMGTSGDTPSDLRSSEKGSSTGMRMPPALFETEVTEASDSSWLMHLKDRLSKNFPDISRSIVVVYLCGVLLVLGRLVQGIAGGHHLRKTAVPVTEAYLLESFGRLTIQIGLKTIPKLAWCKQISTPVVVGIVKPMILLPFEVVTGLNSNQLDALLLHELSHIRRFDPIVNILQRVIEAMLFFHPVIWFLSKRISFERENVADDMVLAAGWGRPQYADTLLRVAELALQNTDRHTALSPSVFSASGNNPSEFKQRILRLLNAQPPKLDISPAVMMLSLLIVGATAMVVYSQGKSGDEPTKSKEPIVTEQSVPKKRSVRISGSVIDAETGNRIEICRMVPAMSDRETSEEITWQSQYMKDFSDGHFVYETDRPWAKTVLRIEADGYQPAMTRWVNEGEVVELKVKLERKVLAGVVKLPSGEPAVRAQVALASWTNEVNVIDGKLTYTGHAEKLRKVIETDDQGRFVIPAEIDSSVLVVAHKEGYAEQTNALALLGRKSPYDQSTSEQFDNTRTVAQGVPVIELRPWGRVEGQVLLGEAPVKGATYWVYQGRNDNFHVSSNESIETDADGRFVVEHVPPGRFGTCYRYAKGSDGASSYSLNGLVAHFDVPVGKTVSLELGGKGRTLIGKLVSKSGGTGEVNWSKTSLQLSLPYPSFMRGLGGVDESATLWSTFLQTEEGKQYTQKKFEVNADGTFRLEGVPAAEYVLSVKLEGKGVPEGSVLGGSKQIIVPAVLPIDQEKPIDLGTISIDMVAASKKSNFIITDEQPPALSKDASEPNNKLGSEESKPKFEAMAKLAAELSESLPTHWRAHIFDEKTIAIMPGIYVRFEDRPHVVLVFTDSENRPVMKMEREDGQYEYLGKTANGHAHLFVSMKITGNEAGAAQMMELFKWLEATEFMKAFIQGDGEKLRTLKKDAANAKPPAKDFVRNGLRFELEAVAYASVEGSSGAKRKADAWWRPDGSKLDGAPEHLTPLSIRKDQNVGKGYREFVMRAQVVNAAQMQNREPGELWLPSTENRWLHTSRWGGPDILKFQLMERIHSDEPISFALYFTEEPGSMLALYGIDGKLQAHTEFDAVTNDLYQHFEVSIVEKNKTTTVVRVQPTSDAARRAKVALAAINVNGLKVDGVQSNTDDNFTVKCPASEIEGFQINLRRMTHKVTFENVAVVPGQKTEPRVIVEPLNTLLRITFRKDGKTLGSFTDVNIQMLEELLKTLQHDLNSESGEIVIYTELRSTFDEAEQIIKKLEAKGWKWPKVKLRPSKKISSSEPPLPEHLRIVIVPPEFDLFKKNFEVVERLAAKSRSSFANISLIKSLFNLID